VKKINTIIIGGGQAGLALSRCLVDLRIDHVILERGGIAQRWKERWDSLRLLTPNWMTRLPGWSYKGDRPEAFMSGAEVNGFLNGYARSFDAPVEEETAVQRASPFADGWRVETNRDVRIAQNVVIATGHAQQTRVHASSAMLPRHIVQIPASAYRNPGQLPAGGVLVAGASASGVQLADELHASGHDVTLAVGRHNRLPRRYRGRDIMVWLDRIGSLQRPLSDMPDPEEAKHEPSLQLVGDVSGRTTDLTTLSHHGVRLAGRLAAVNGSRVRFQDDLAQQTAAADQRLGRLLSRIDQHIETHALQNDVQPPDPWALTPPVDAPAELDLDRTGIRSVVWATGFRRTYDWLEADVLDARGDVRNDRGHTPAPGLFIIGMQFMIRRNSSFIDGVGRDAAEIALGIARRAGALGREAA